MQINPEVLIYLPAKESLSGGGLRCNMKKKKGTSNARKMENDMQFQCKQIDWESTNPEKDSCTRTDDDFVAECSSADNSIHTPAPSETSRSSAQRRTRPRSGKRPLEEAMIEIERKKLDMM
jgi:hypothetical protein